MSGVNYDNYPVGWTQVIAVAVLRHDISIDPSTAIVTGLAMHERLASW